MDDFGPTSHGFQSQRLRLNYYDWGNPGAPLLLLVHGGMDHARSWDWVARALRDRWHVVAPDLRGHGDSAWSPDGAYSSPFFVADLAQLVHQLADGPCSIVAHSLGGAISLRYTGLFPETVRKLVAIEGIGLPLDGHEDDTDATVERWRSFTVDRRALSARTPRRYASIEEALERMRAVNGFLSVEQARHLTIHGVTRNEDGSYSWKFDNYVRSGSPVDLSAGQIRALWGRIDCPTWLVHGADSWAKHPDEDGRSVCFKDARVTSYERAGHWVHHDRFDAFVAELSAFLDA
jgi:pimeloyl-ACP methyl ester carboxylesterase